MIEAADLFCGAGGTSLGLGRACESLGIPVTLRAYNHWPTAISTHSLNHPWATHKCAELEVLDPRKEVPGRKLDLLIAGVECTHHSRARGGRPMSDQSRASAWHVLHWVEQLHVDNVLIENVAEWLDWGPLDDEGRPIKERKGETFRAFVQALESLDYLVEWRLLTAADYGDPTTRRRLFLRARRARRAIDWPDPSHAEKANGLPPWRTAREIIDWSNLGTSIFARRRPLADRTMARIEEGIRRYCGELAEPFLVILKGRSTVRGVDEPVPTLTAHARHLGLAQPFLVHVNHHKRRPPRAIDEPLPTLTTKNGLALAVRPLNTVRTKGAGHLVTPFLVPHFGERPGQAPRVHSIDRPMPTVTATKGSASLCAPFLTMLYGTNTVRDVDRPLPTVTATGQHIAVTTPFYVPYYGTGVPRSVDRPLGTVTSRHRFGLVAPTAETGDGTTYALDIFFRMLEPKELQLAQGFPRDYRFAGNKGDVVRQIGNAVPVGTAEHLCRAILAGGGDA